MVAVEAKEDNKPDTIYTHTTAQKDNSEDTGCWDRIGVETVFLRGLCLHYVISEQKRRPDETIIPRLI